MLFLTIFFITFTLCKFIKGNLLHDRFIKFEETRLKQAEGALDTEIDLGLQAIKILVMTVPIVILNISYLLCAVSIDPFKYPTLAVIALMILIIIKPKKKDDINTEEGRQKLRVKLYTRKRSTFKGFMLNLLWLTYYLYMLHAIVFH